MADITSLNQGEVDDSGKVNWRGDQVTLPQGGQSIYKTSTVQLAELGERKVVGDRVFRYAKAGGTIAAGDLCQMKALEAKQIANAAAANATPGAKVLTLLASTNLAKNAYAEGYVHVESGTAANRGYMYRIKSHSSIGSGANGTFYLYDVIQQAIATADSVTMTPNLYLDSLQCTGTANVPIGFAPIAAASADYLWLTSWGPTPAKFSAGAPTIGMAAMVGLTGAVQSVAASTNRQDVQVGVAMYSCTASDLGMVFAMITP